MSHHTADPEFFVIRERFHVFVLLLAPLLVFIGGIWLATTDHSGGLGIAFLDAFGGLILCIGALFTYAIILVRRVLREAPLIENAASAERSLPTAQRVQRLAVLFALFVASWIAQALYGIAGHVLFQSGMIIFGMLAATLTAHFHAHH